jgi:hypothetical protein
MKGPISQPHTVPYLMHLNREYVYDGKQYELGKVGTSLTKPQPLSREMGTK